MCASQFFAPPGGAHSPGRVLWHCMPLRGCSPSHSRRPDTSCRYTYDTVGKVGLQLCGSRRAALSCSVPRCPTPDRVRGEPVRTSSTPEREWHVIVPFVRWLSDARWHGHADGLLGDLSSVAVSPFQAQDPSLRSPHRPSAPLPSALSAGGLRTSLVPEWEGVTTAAVPRSCARPPARSHRLLAA